MKGERRRIDWEEVRTRLRASQLALEQALTVSPERLEAAYRERALQLANRGTQAVGPDTTVPVLAFLLRAERYGLELADVAEIVPYARVTPVPGAPAALLGVMNLHGEIRSILDLGRVLNLPGEEGPAAGYVLRVRKRGTEVGLRVDALDRVQRVAPGTLAVPEDDGSAARRCLRGLTPDRLRLLSTDALLGHALVTGKTK